MTDTNALSADASTIPGQPDMVCHNHLLQGWSFINNSLVKHHKAVVALIIINISRELDPRHALENILQRNEMSRLFAYAKTKTQIS